MKKVLGVEDLYTDHPINRLSKTVIQSLEDLQSFFNKLEHPLKEGALNLVFSNGNIGARIMIIGEAPGAEEDIQGKPFVGKSGELLTKMLQAIHISREDVYITNILPWRPPMNRNPSKEEMSFFLPYVKKHIQFINPKCIVLLGSIAAQTLLGITKISAVRGKWHKLSIGNKEYNILPTFHPSYLLRSPGQKKLAWQDMLEVQRFLMNS